jgi:hypothetical protein
MTTMKSCLKMLSSLALAASGLVGANLFGQPGTPLPPPLRTIARPGTGEVLTKFDLDFPGGSPKDLVTAIQKAMGRQLNVIIPEDTGPVKLPALKMEHIDVPQLFSALGAASHKEEAVSTGRFPGAPGYQPYQPYQVTQTGYGFNQAPNQPLSDDTIWYFFVSKPVPTLSQSAPKVCRFYSLTPYLQQSLTVDDITTAVETGWKMLGETPTPTISFHKDTKLLIAVGEPSKLETIDAALKALESSRPHAGPPASTPAPKPAEKPKADE